MIYPLDHWTWSPSPRAELPLRRAEVLSRALQSYCVRRWRLSSRWCAAPAALIPCSLHALIEAEAASDAYPHRIFAIFSARRRPRTAPPICTRRLRLSGVGTGTSLQLPSDVNKREDALPAGLPYRGWVAGGSLRICGPSSSSSPSMLRCTRVLQRSCPAQHCQGAC